MTPNKPKLQADRDELAKILETLLMLKAYKDKKGKDDFYVKAQAEAWKLAGDTLLRVWSE